MEYTFAYHKCQSCTERINCDRCAEKLTEELLLEPDILSTEIQMGTKHLKITSALDIEPLEAVLEEHGIFV